MKYAAGQTTAGRVAIAVCFTLTFAWFGLSSFWRGEKEKSASVIFETSATQGPKTEFSGGENSMTEKLKTRRDPLQRLKPLPIFR